MNKMIVCVAVFSLAGLPSVHANEAGETEQGECVCLQLPCPDDWGLETLTEEKPEVVCVPLAVNLSKEEKDIFSPHPVFELRQ